MRQALVTADGVLINPAQITTARRAHDSMRYQKESYEYNKWAQQITLARDEGREEDADRLEEEFQKVFPKGRPNAEDYFKTEVKLSDGRALWVEASLTVVRYHIEQG